MRLGLLPVTVILATACLASRGPTRGTDATGAVALSSSPLPVSAGPALRWMLHLADDLHLHQRVCRADGIAVTEADRVGPVDARASRFATPLVVVDGCFDNDIDLAGAALALDARSAAARVGDDIVMASPDVWLWTTAGLRAGTLAVTTAPGLRFALPFPLEADGSFSVDPSTWRYLSCAMFGRFDVHSVIVADVSLDVVVLPGERLMVGADVDRWLGAAVTAVSLGAGQGHRFPFERTQVTVEPVWGAGVPFGMVSRGGGPQAHLLLGQQARIDDVIGSWVAVHELSHLLHPLLDVSDAWFGEGFASYQQNILRARAGLMTEDECWAALADGLRRGADASLRGPRTRSLQDASSAMRTEGAYLQVYWGGAAVVLWLDVALRRCADRSIDDVVATFRAEQPRVDARRVPAREIVARAAATATECAYIAEEVDNLLREPFPRVGMALLGELGVADAGLSSTAPLARLREAITRPTAGGP